jgi:hypothetical protein
MRLISLFIIDGDSLVCIGAQTYTALNVNGRALYSGACQMVGGTM